MTPGEFWAWFDKEMGKRGFSSIREIEEKGNVGNATISQRRRENLPPTDTVIRGIAEAFGMSFETVRGLYSGSVPNRAETLTMRELYHILEDMSLEEQQDVLEYALFKIARRDQSQQGGRPSARKPEPATN